MEGVRQRIYGRVKGEGRGTRELTGRVDEKYMARDE